MPLRGASSSFGFNKGQRSSLPVSATRKQQNVPFNPFNETNLYNETSKLSEKVTPPKQMNTNKIIDTKPKSASVNRFGFRGIPTNRKTKPCKEKQETVFPQQRSEIKPTDEYNRFTNTNYITEKLKTQSLESKEDKYKKANPSLNSQHTGFSSDEEDDADECMKDILPRSPSPKLPTEENKTVESVNDNTLGCGEELAFDELEVNSSFRDVLLALEDTTFAPLAILSVSDTCSPIENESFPEILSQNVLVEQ